MITTPSKPKLVFFQYEYDAGLPEFLLIHTREHVRCLSESFEVTVINEDCDYQQVCDKYQPDLVLFESGVNLFTCRRPHVSNLHAYPAIPRLGFLNADAWCETRSGSLSEMEQWGIEAFFSISATAPEHMPCIADKLFILPNFIDDSVYRDYAEAKLIPVLLSGATAAQYPWRQGVYKLVSDRYPSLSCPHRGYLTRSPAGQVLHGERYARTINASQVVPVCGTVAKEVVRKHFEIPACNACLVTERSPHLEAAGFIDMTNCVFADEHDVLDKLDFLFSNPDTLRTISAAGHSLVHSKHTLRHRSQILEWFTLHKNLQPNEKIVQPGLFSPLTIATGEKHESTSLPPSIGQHLRLLHEGDERLWAGQIDAAEDRYRRCLDYMRRLPEARLKLAICNLYRGAAREANSQLFELVQYCLSEYQAIDPDPVEWCYYIVSLLCLGQISNAKDCAREFPWMSHPDLEYLRRVLLSLDGIGAKSSSGESGTAYRYSIHAMPMRGGKAWQEQFCTMLKASKQSSLAETIGQMRIPSTPSGEASHRTFDLSVSRQTLSKQLPSRLVPSLKGTARAARRLGALNRRLIFFRVERKRQKLKNVAAQLVRKIGQVWTSAIAAALTKDPEVS